ncbi:ATP-binding protein [Ferrimicrobium sp.]|uniref:ATP-binding protein n=1 Tax=Ferrimicrobium sp. TaxID=2926050 RepID=UPI00345B512B
MWGGSLHQRTVVDAIMDRIVHNAIPVELRGESMRKQRSQRKENGSTEPGPKLSERVVQGCAKPWSRVRE